MSLNIVGVILAAIFCREIFPKVNEFSFVEYTFTGPFAVAASLALPFFRFAWLAIDSGIATSVAPVSTRKVTGTPFIVPAAV